MIYCDDLGYGDLHCYGSEIRTPNLDRMAAEGVRFTNWNSANPLCSPSRAALLTGRYPTRVGVPRVLGPKETTGIPDDEMTMGQLLKGLNYKTICIGKWHLGHLPQFLPTRHGFDSYFGIPYSNDMYPTWLIRDTQVVEQQANLETLTERYTNEALGFLERSKGSPFFLYFAHTLPHIPLAAGKRFRGRSRQGLYGDVLEEIDWSVGEVLAKIKSLGADNNTLVMFSSDNGPWYQGSPGRLRGRKGMTWEGGVREPFIARFPGRIPKGRVCQGLGSMMDVFPTGAKLTGARLPSKPLDGVDAWPMMSGAAESIDREPLLYFDNVNLQCARWGRWKLHLARNNHATWSAAPADGHMNLPLPAPELYDLESDSDESYDVSPEHPEIVRQIGAKVETMMATFPENVRASWAQTKARKARWAWSGPFWPAGINPQVAK